MIYFWLVLLWLATAIRWRIDLGFISFAFVEPVAIITIVVLLVNQYTRKRRVTIVAEPVALLLIVFGFWVIVVRVWGQNTINSLSDIRDWLIPICTYVVLISTIKRGWRKLVLLFVAVGFLSALLGLYQFFTDSFRPFSTEGAAFKAGYIIVAGSSFEPISAALAFFEHPNSLAVYLILALTISLGWWQEGNQRVLKIAVMSILFAALLSTYAKAEIIAFVLIVILYVLSWFIRSPKIFGLTAVGLIGVGVASIWIGMKIIPQYFGTFWWRVTLWDTAVKVITMNPVILIWGNGNIIFAQNAIWPQPHNLFIDILLKYGLIGLIILGTIGWILLRYGFIAYRHSINRQFVIMRAVWMSLLIFGITGLVESSFISIETRMIFVLTMACTIGLIREVLLESKFAEKRPEELVGQLWIAKSTTS